MKMTTGFTGIQEGDFKMCFQQWQYSWSKCACAEKQCFKGDWFMSYIYIYIYIYRVSQEECAILRESVPYVKLY